MQQSIWSVSTRDLTLCRLGFFGLKVGWGVGEGAKRAPSIISLLFNELQRNLAGLVIGWCFTN